MRDFRLLFSRNPSFDKCPECGEHNSLKRSRSRSTWEQIVKRLTFYKIYRCKKCGWRGYRTTYIFTKESLKTLGLYLILVLSAAFIIRFILLKFVIR